ncbi:hypothetical protein GGX14DRAFT_397383 [Mycena pura]|uniref:Uncharacterized protein n=1 Tax=Mycena pura TaxID=153505 RepID=A0AAD6VCQ0_9AGAR|nr:hypothetical protein GGX14DRAFT_397383 [Mycena pura]
MYSVRRMYSVRCGTCMHAQWRGSRVRCAVCAAAGSSAAHTPQAHAAAPACMRRGERRVGKCTPSGACDVLGWACMRGGRRGMRRTQRRVATQHMPHRATRGTYAARAWHCAAYMRTPRQRLHMCAAAHRRHAHVRCAARAAAGSRAAQAPSCVLATCGGEYPYGTRRGARIRAAGRTRMACGGASGGLGSACVAGRAGVGACVRARRSVAGRAGVGACMRARRSYGVRRRHTVCGGACGARLRRGTAGSNAAHAPPSAYIVTRKMYGAHRGACMRAAGHTHTACGEASGGLRSVGMLMHGMHSCAAAGRRRTVCGRRGRDSWVYARVHGNPRGAAGAERQGQSSRGRARAAQAGM